MNKKKISLLIFAYIVIHFLIRILFSQTLQVDDAEQIRLSQALLLGYSLPQPPLYSWLSWGMFQTFGAGLLTIHTNYFYFLDCLACFWAVISASSNSLHCHFFLPTNAVICMAYASRVYTYHYAKLWHYSFASRFIKH